MTIDTACYRYTTPHRMITVRYCGEHVQRIDLTAAGDDCDVLRGALAAWLDAYFQRQPLPEVPPLCPPRHRLDAAMRAYLLAIPAGQTRTYGQLAAAIGTSPRAAGSLLRANPLPIVIPCHRIVARNGRGGFSGGDEWKQFLWQHEAGH